MDLWWHLRGWTRHRLTSADCTARLAEISREIRLEDIVFENDLTAAFSTSGGSAEKVFVRDGDTIETIGVGGLPVLLGKIRRWKLLAAAAALLFASTVFLQGRILFLQVEGGGEIPARLILERAGECGVCFGASAKSIRSEGLKNHLLRTIPQLRWAGVNVLGCTATITVEPRQPGEEPESAVPGDIVAAMDAVVTEVYPTTGILRCTPGQAVRAGEVLISGMADLGLLVRTDRAEGEVYGLTRRTVKVVLPAETLIRTESGRTVKKISLMFGKKSVNFWNDSGILYGTCVKMRKVNYVMLPGGYRLPAALVTESRQLCEAEAVSREMDRDQLMDAARQYVLEQMTAGTILREEMTLDGQTLTAVFECRELIGVFQPGTMLEGDTNDRENGERGAG